MRHRTRPPPRAGPRSIVERLNIEPVWAQHLRTIQQLKRRFAAAELLAGADNPSAAKMAPISYTTITDVTYTAGRT